MLSPDKWQVNARVRLEVRSRPGSLDCALPGKRICAVRDERSRSAADPALERGIGNPVERSTHGRSKLFLPLTDGRAATCSFRATSELLMTRAGPSVEKPRYQLIAVALGVVGIRRQVPEQLKEHC